MMLMVALQSDYGLTKRIRRINTTGCTTKTQRIHSLYMYMAKADAPQISNSTRQCGTTTLRFTSQPA